MNKLLVILVSIVTLAVPVTVRAQYYSVNVDARTIATMSEAFATEGAMEALHNENLQKIYDSYKAAEVATAGIFASKYLDRKALTNLNLWNEKEENYYYTRIYNIVSKRIIPKTIVCAQLMLEDPSTAIYWGSYLVKVCADVKSLCTQFESIVTNSTLSFSDIAFVQISEELASLFNLQNLGGIDWKDMFEHLGDDIENAVTAENVKADLDNLISKGVGLASAGFSGAVSNFTAGTSFDGSFQNKVSSVITMTDNIKTLFDDVKDQSATGILTTLAGEDALSQLFNLSDYNLTRWITDYESAAQGQYYTQRVYIYRVDAGTEVLCDYYPPTDDDAILYGNHWYRIDTTDPDFYPSSAQWEAILQNSEARAGWSRSKVQQLNNSNDGYSYSMTRYSNAYILSKKKSGQYAKAYAYDIHVSRSWYNKEEVYEDVFDSYSMDWNTFMAQMNVKLNQYNENGDHTEITNIDDLNQYINSHPTESSYTYYIGYDTKHYYQATNARKIAGAASATFTLTCHDGGTLGSGATSYKCRSCGSNPSSHTKDCSMATTLSGENFDTSELSSTLSQLETDARNIQSQIDNLNRRNSELLRLMANTSDQEQYLAYQAEYNQNKGKITDLQKQLEETNKSIAETKQAIEEAEEGEKAETDDYNRIPQIMQQMKNAYNIQWTDAGSWSGYTFIRHGTMGDVNGQLTFKATVSIARKPKYFLGIKIHRAIVQIDWELTSTWADSNVVEIMDLDPSKSDEENARIVNARLSELAREYPRCEVTVEYSRRDPLEVEDTEGTYHLLWASDRLEIAKSIEARLAKIYTDLAMIEKFLHYRHSLLDWVHDLLPKLNADNGRKMTIADRCRRRWMHNSGSSYYDREEEDNEYEEYE